MGLGMMAQGMGPMLAMAGAGATVLTGIGSAIGTMAMAAGTAVPALAALSLVIASNPLLVGAIAVAGIAAAGYALLTMGGSADRVTISAKEAAQAVRDLDTASNALAGNNIGQKEADMQVVVAKGQAAAAQRAYNQAVAEHGPKSSQARQAAQQLAQADLAVERSANSAAEARERNTGGMDKAA